MNPLSPLYFYCIFIGIVLTCYETINQSMSGYPSHWIIYNLNQWMNDDISHIDGDWIRSGQNIYYHDNILCADLRKYGTIPNYELKSGLLPEISYPVDTRVTVYKKMFNMVKVLLSYRVDLDGFYRRACIRVNKNETIRLTNDNGYFSHDKSSETFSHKLTFPRGPWGRSLYGDRFVNKRSFIFEMSFFPNSMCYLNQRCIIYQDEDLLDYVGPRFIILPKTNRGSNFSKDHCDDNI